jgi:sugar phosphate permease
LASLFVASVGVLVSIGLACAAFLRESPPTAGNDEPDRDLDGVDGTFGLGADADAGMIGILLKIPAFWVVCSLSLGVTLLRETFSTWTPTYFVEQVGMSKTAAAQASALFPLAGGFSVLLAGFASDWLGRPGRCVILLLGLALAGPGRRARRPRVGRPGPEPRVDRGALGPGGGRLVL